MRRSLRQAIDYRTETAEKQYPAKLHYHRAMSSVLVDVALQKSRIRQKLKDLKTSSRLYGVCRAVD